MNVLLASRACGASLDGVCPLSFASTPSHRVAGSAQMQTRRVYMCMLADVSAVSSKYTVTKAINELSEPWIGQVALPASLKHVSLASRSH